MSESLRESLLAAGVVSHTFVAEDGYRAVVIHDPITATEIALRVFAAWLDERAGWTREARGVPDRSDATWLAMAMALESARDEVRREVSDAG